MNRFVNPSTSYGYVIFYGIAGSLNLLVGLTNIVVSLNVGRDISAMAWVNLVLGTILVVACVFTAREVHFRRLLVAGYREEFKTHGINDFYDRYSK